MSAKSTSGTKFSKLFETFQEFPPFDRSEAHTTADVRTLMFAIRRPFELKAVDLLLHIANVMLPALSTPKNMDEKRCFDIVGVFSFDKNFTLQDDLTKECKYVLLVNDGEWLGILIACPLPVYEVLVNEFYQDYFNELFFKTGEKECPIFCISDVFDAYPTMEVTFPKLMKKSLEAEEA